MTWEQKLEACQAIGSVALKMRGPGDWYINHDGVNRIEGEGISGGHISAPSPEVAVNDHWAWLTDTKYRAIKIRDAGATRTVFWNGFMWATWSKE